MEIGNTLGSDIAFFLNQCSWALGEGRGEQITRLQVSEKFWHILVVFGVYGPLLGNGIKVVKYMIPP